MILLPLYSTNFTSFHDFLTLVPVEAQHHGNSCKVSSGLRCYLFQEHYTGKDLLSSYSLFDVEKSSAQKVVGALKGNEFYGHRIYAELATDKDYSAPKGKRKGKEEGGRRTNEKRYGNSRRDHSESRSRRDRSSSKTKRSSYSSKKRKG